MLHCFYTRHLCRLTNSYYSQEVVDVTSQQKDKAIQADEKIKLGAKKDAPF